MSLHSHNFSFDNVHEVFLMFVSIAKASLAGKKMKLYTLHTW